MKHAEKLHYAGIAREVYDTGEFVFLNRLANAMHDGVNRYPIVRTLRFAARVELEALLDAIALDKTWRVERPGLYELLIDGDGLFITGYGGRKADYCSLSFCIWAEDVARAEAARQRLLDKAGTTRITEPMFSIDWHFLTSRGDLENAAIEEIANDVLYDGAYPEIEGGVGRFIQGFLDAQETVLVLQGPPGTGKTRLIRALLAEMSRRKGSPSVALYTGDMKALQSDQVFVKFITGFHDAFVVEDADHVLKPRADGNEDLHRFLTIADGVVRSQGRKIVFSTNLPNVGDLDEALVRPGRCFARVHVRGLSGDEAHALAQEIASGDAEKLQRASTLFVDKKRGHSLAEVYQALR